MSRLFERVIGGLVLLFVVVYSGYQGYRYFSSPIRTETVFQYTQSNSVQVQGVAIRDEIVIDQRISGIESYTFDDGTRVSVGQTVAEFYTSDVGDQNIRRVRELQQEIDMLRQAQDKSINNYANVDILNRNIREQLVYLTDMTSRNRYDETSEIRSDMVSLINRKQIAIGRVQSFEERIAQLQAEYSRLEPHTARESMMVVTAPESGYFSKVVDGYEHLLSYSALENYTLADYDAIFSGKLRTGATGSVGRLVQSQRWAFVSKLPKYSAQWLRTGQSVNVYFESIGETVPATVTEILQEPEADDMVVVLTCEYISDELVNLRMEKATISHQEFTGLRINVSDIRFRGWVFEATLPRQGAEWMRAGQSVTVHFDSTGGQVTARITQVTQEEDSDDATVLLTCDLLPDQQVTHQVESATILHNELSEQPASSTADLLYQGEVRGVYVLEGHEIRFKAIDPIYEESGFVLSNLNFFDSVDKQHVRLYDQVITRGNDIYDGKVIR